MVEAFRGDEVLVLNDTRVVPARLRGRKVTGGAVEVFFAEPLGRDPAGGTRIAALLRGKRLRVGVDLELPGTAVTVAARRADGTFELCVRDVAAEDLWRWLDEHGEVPLPPYIKRVPDAADRARYQTVFAQAPGAVAAPTAGLHFTDGLLDAIRARGVAVHRLTLHVGLGTFLPVRSDDPSEHRLHAERFEVPDDTARALRSGRAVIAVGTTVVRALESWAREPGSSRTELFILPGFEFRVVDGLLTNFHLPESSLLMLVCAFAGRERVLDAYAHAVAARLRFYSYGDAMLLRRSDGRWSEEETA